MHCILHCILCLCIVCFISVSLHLCISLCHCQTLSLCTSSTCHSHFVSLHELCPLPTLVDIGISRCYQTSMAFPLHPHMHLGVLVCWFRVLLFSSPSSLSVSHHHLGQCQMHKQVDVWDRKTMIPLWWQLSKLSV